MHSNSLNAEVCLSHSLLCPKCPKNSWHVMGAQHIRVEWMNQWASMGEEEMGTLMSPPRMYVVSFHPYTTTAQETHNYLHLTNKETEVRQR